MPVGRLGAIKKYPLALVRRTGLQSSEPLRLRQTDHLHQHATKVTGTRCWGKLDRSRISHRQYDGKFPAYGDQLARCLVGLRPKLRRSQQKISQGLPQFQRSPVAARIDMLCPAQQAALPHPGIQHVWRLDLIPAAVRNAIFDVAAPVEAVDEIVKQRELRRYDVFL